MKSFGVFFVVALIPCVVLADVPDKLGSGFDVANSNFWDMTPLVEKRVFEGGIPEECVSSDSIHSSSTDVQTFDSEVSWAQAFAKTVSVEASVPIPFTQMVVSVQHSKGQSDAFSWFKNTRGSYGWSFQRIGGFQIKSQCMDKRAKEGLKLSSALVKTLRAMPKKDTSEATMRQWVTNVINNYGSHVAVATDNGAQIRVYSTLDNSCRNATDCAAKSTCFKFDLMKLHIGGCHNSTQCSLSSSCESMFSSSCTITGGNPNISAQQVCSGEVKATDFLNSGDPVNSIYNLHLMPLADIIEKYGYVDESNLLRKAEEYHSCNGPRRWGPSAQNAGDFACQCDLQCNNSGKLNTDTCTCDCVGDEAHGWWGADCSATYGKCQCGPGSRPSGDEDCCNKGNVCGGGNHAVKCQDTDVCCSRATDAVCCPFGNVCRKHAPGGWDCVPQNPRLPSVFIPWMRTVSE